MAEQIYRKEFNVSRNTSYYGFENDQKVCEKALNEANEFFIKHGEFDIINVVEDWSEEKSYLSLAVYYKGYV